MHSRKNPPFCGNIGPAPKTLTFNPAAPFRGLSVSAAPATLLSSFSQKQPYNASKNDENAKNNNNHLSV